MKDTSVISRSVISRLPRYYRFLGELMKQGVNRISSKDLAGMMGLTASQIRQDLNCFGGFGQQGYGYNVPALRDRLAEILGLDKTYTAVLIGAGNLGRAVAGHMSFEDRGFRLIGIFDVDPLYKGIKIRGLPILQDSMLPEFCAASAPDMAVLCVPSEAAPAVVEQLIGCGIRNFWNFSHYDIKRDHPDVNVENVHLNDSLMMLSYTIKNRQDEAK
jgi:redox-sensing transcriptional repressor